jgi:hypothetical protein
VRGKVPTKRDRSLCGDPSAQGRARAADVAQTIKALQAAGATVIEAIADGLNEQKIPTARGNGEWTATQVMRVLERIDAAHPSQ